MLRRALLGFSIAGLLSANALAKRPASSSRNKYEIFQSKKNGDWYWRLKAGNGQPIASGGEGYKSKSGCKAAVRRIQNSCDAEIIVIDNSD